MTKRMKAISVGTTAVAAAAGVAFAVLPASADGGGSGHAAHGATEGVALRAGAPGDSRGAVFFAASLNGANEVPTPGGPAVGDRDGVALQFVKVRGDVVSFAVKWRGTDRPSALHIHQGDRGVNGGIKVDFSGELGRSGGRTVQGSAQGSAQGSVRVQDRALLAALKDSPTGFYANLHTRQFPGGAVRGQLHRVTRSFDFGRALENFRAPVLRGEQIYECKKAADGTTSFQQRDVRAVLAGGIAHSFVAPNSGTPQWIARDRSKVVGTLISRSPNGADNIPELDLAGQASGRPGGLFSRTTEILRLNTVGGVAPAGSCTPGSLSGVPYRADYVFIQR
ncbi:CHRD domain-containing protein [Streptomyces sp. NBC_00237]|uniref:CHRD domain-containing protein n=1 Tax=Streptomyces sp. NBC_00237 TaxID=2975687 RepID=UPI00225725EC|nr:CHRD domain-containing protein [Streptomyces sp. NBC_00237]MCX5204905.1 CHRD domain-containing protein [Streptomyces sp. NBC_00237]